MLNVILFTISSFWYEMPICLYVPIAICNICIYPMLFDLNYLISSQTGTNEKIKQKN